MMKSKQDLIVENPTEREVATALKVTGRVRNRIYDFNESVTPLRTDLFCDLYLNKRNEMDSQSNVNCNFEEMSKLYELCYVREIQENIAKLNYKEFLQTPFWEIITDFLKGYQRGESCQICNSNENLHVHHKTYENHGKSEGLKMYNLRDLIVVCADCHKMIHDNKTIK